MFEVVAGIGFRSRVTRRARPTAGARMTGFFLTVVVGVLPYATQEEAGRANQVDWMRLAGSYTTKIISWCKMIARGCADLFTHRSRLRRVLFHPQRCCFFCPNPRVPYSLL